MVSKAGVQDLTGLAGTGENIQGEEQKKLDILSNDVFKDKLTKTGCMVPARTPPRQRAAAQKRYACTMVRSTPSLVL